MHLPLQPPPCTWLRQSAVSHRGVGVEIDMDDIRVPFTKEEAIELQKELLRKFASQDFQDRLRECAASHGTHSLAFRREHQELVLQLQVEVLPKFGFEASLDGVVRMTEEIRALKYHQEVADNADDIDLLIWSCGGRPPKPPEQRHAALPWAEATPVLPEVYFVQVGTQDGYWMVVGGRRSGGLVVRQSEELDAETEPQILAIGAVVKELEWSDDLLHYRKVSGEGPEQGWVKWRSRRVNLLESFEGWLPAERF
uniref:Protein C10 n=1 Tax=Alexandrium monilatum TaxID=311494 RepID=A0A7S4T0H6_9DINO